MKITNTKDVEMVKVKAIVYGKSGVGKTYSAKTLNEETTLIVSAESGILALHDTQFDVCKIDQWPDVNELFHLLSSDEYQKKYKCVFIDSLTELNEKCKEHIVRVERPAIKTDLGKVYEDLMTMQDYQLLQEKIKRFVRAFRDLPYHIFFTCLEDNSKNEKTGEIEFVPSLNGKMSTHIAAYFDEVFRLITKNEGDSIGRYFVTDKVEGMICKDRSGKLDTYEPASWSVVMKKILSEKSEQKTKKGDVK